MKQHSQIRRTSLCFPHTSLYPYISRAHTEKKVRNLRDVNILICRYWRCDVNEADIESEILCDSLLVQFAFRHEAEIVGGHYILGICSLRTVQQDNPSSTYSFLLRGLQHEDLLLNSQNVYIDQVDRGVVLC